MSRGRGTSDRDALRGRILDFVSRRDYRPVPAEEMLRRLRVPSAERRLARRCLDELVREGRIARLGGRRFALPPAEGAKPRTAGGRLPVSSDGSPRPIVGLFLERARGGLVEPFDGLPAGGVRIPGPFTRGARDGDAVEVEILRTTDGPEPAEGKVVEVLGRLGDPGVDVLVVARKYGLVLEFPEPVAEAARRLPEAVPRSEASRRERFDDPPPVTIDGETARDFDDAVAVAQSPDGGFRLFVHVADVSWFVKRGTPLDREAQRRGTSVYFPERVLPMLPERLSNDLCSLRPHEDRLVQTVVLDLDREGRVRGARFSEGVIRSAARLTYTRAARVVEGDDHVPGVPRAVVPMLRLANRLRERLEARRHERGSVDFDLPEPEILLDVEGVMTGITVSPRNDAHRMIEEFMIAANEAVAGHLASIGAPCLYRVHESPDPAKMEALGEFARALGLALGADPEKIRPRDLQRFLARAEAMPEYPVLAQVVLRSMKQARYSVENVGHFGLASEVYAHFTSPIRRYPDLAVHRILRASRHGRRDALESLGRGLEEIAESCSRLERDAEAAERELLTWKKVAFMKGKEGEIHEGLVTGVAPFGLFVQLAETLVEGLVRMEALGREFWDFLSSRHEIRGRRSGRSFRLGERLKVRVLRVDPIRRRVDLGLAEEAAAAAGLDGEGTPRTLAEGSRSHRRADRTGRSARRQGGRDRGRARARGRGRS